MDEMKNLRWWAWYAAAWLPVWLAISAALLITDRAAAGAALLAGFTSTVPAAILGVPVVWLTRLLPWGATSAWRVCAPHLVGALLYGTLWSATIAVLIRSADSRESFEQFMRFGAAWQVVSGAFAYAVIAGISYTRVAIIRQRQSQRAAELAETLRLKAELDALRMRLEPHFLFNVLQTVGALITADRQSKAHEALELLASLLKRRLDAARTGDDATLSEEIYDVHEYLALERLRLGDRLTVVEAIDATTRDFLLPRFTLQPLVENALRHGISPLTRAARVSVSSRVRGAGWELQVEDDGAGAPAVLAGVAGVGITVMRDRLRMRFGDSATIAITTSPGAGFSVALRLPIDQGNA